MGEYKAKPLKPSHRQIANRSKSYWEERSTTKAYLTLSRGQPHNAESNRPGIWVVIVGFNRGVTQHHICSGKDSDVRWDLRTRHKEKNLKVFTVSPHPRHPFRDKQDSLALLER